MPTSDNNQIVSHTHKLWENRLSFETRQKFIDYYQQGYAVYKIARTYKVTAGTVEYHLRVAKVYVPGKKPTKRNIEIQGPQQVLLPSRTLSIILIPKVRVFRNDLERKLYEEDQATEKLQATFPRCYKEYLARARARHPKIYNGIYASTINTWSIQ